MGCCLSVTVPEKAGCAPSTAHRAPGRRSAELRSVRVRSFLASSAAPLPLCPVSSAGPRDPPPPTPQAAHPLQLKPLKHNCQQRGGRKGDQPAGTAPPRRDARFRPAAGGKSPCLSFSGEIATGILVPKLQHNFP